MSFEINRAEVKAIVEEVVTKLAQEGVLSNINATNIDIDNVNTSNLYPPENNNVSKITNDIAVKADYKDFGLAAFMTKKSTAPYGHGIFGTVDDAVLAATEAQKTFIKLPIETRKKIIQMMRVAGAVHAEELAKMAVGETDLGRIEDKVKKNMLAVEKTPGVEDLESLAVSGDRGLTLIEMAPYGVIGAITPSTNPAATIINNSISMVASGNSVVFNPHPGAKKVSLHAMEIMNEAIEKGGGPPNLLTSVGEPTIETSNAIMKHSEIRILVVTGGPGVVLVAMASGKKTIAAGPGNPPVVVDETADIIKAARDIVNGSSFDNNVMCQAEKEVFVVDKAASHLIEEMQRCGAYLLSSDKVKKIKEIVFNGNTRSCGDAVINRNFVGKNASFLAAAIGLDLPDHIRLLMCETPPDDTLVMSEQLMPLLPIVRVKDVWDGIDWALKAEGGRGHTASMHSKNVEHLSNMANRVNTAIFVKNGPTYAGLGFGGEGHTTLTIGTTTGEGITSARHFTRTRRCVLVDYFRII